MVSESPSARATFDKDAVETSSPLSIRAIVGRDKPAFPANPSWLQPLEARAARMVLAMLTSAGSGASADTTQPIGLTCDSMKSISSELSPYLS
jgi:hypothetical protein